MSNKQHALGTRAIIYAMSKEERDIFYDLQALAVITTPQQNYDCGKQLKLTNSVTQKYIEGKGKNKQLAERLYQILSDRWLKDQLLRVERDLERLAKTKKEVLELEKDVRLCGEMARVMKRNFDLAVTDIPEGVDRLDWKKNYFLESARHLTDPEVYNQMVLYIENITSDARAKLQKSQIDQNEQTNSPEAEQ